MSEQQRFADTTVVGGDRPGRAAFGQTEADAQKGHIGRSPIAVRHRGEVSVQGQVRQVHRQPGLGSRRWQRACQLNVVLQHAVSGRGIAHSLANKSTLTGARAPAARLSPDGTRPRDGIRRCPSSQREASRGTSRGCAGRAPTALSAPPLPGTHLLPFADLRVQHYDRIPVLELDVNLTADGLALASYVGRLVATVILDPAAPDE